MSPITFATREEISDDEQVLEEDAHDMHTDDADPLIDLSDPLLSDKYKYVPRPATADSPNKSLIPKATSASTSSDPSYYVLLVFSTGQILEDHYKLAWYPTHPHELLELHAHPFLVSLPRALVEDYVRPYLEVHAWVLRLLDDFGSGSGVGERLGKVLEVADQERDKIAKKRRLKVSPWQERWVIVREGHFQVCKERKDSTLLHSIPLSSMVSLRGADYIREIRKNSIDASRVGITDKRIICVRFRYEQRSAAWFRRGSRDATAGEEPRKVVSTYVEEDETIAEDGDTMVFAIQVHDETAYDNLLRILHRDSHSAPSSFFPTPATNRSRRRSYSPISFASVSSGETPPSSPETFSPPRSLSPDKPKPTGVQYPEWRMEVVRKARRAGLGDVGRAMELAMFGADIHENSGVPESESHQPKQGRRRGRQPNDGWNGLLESDSDQESAEDSGSEREWEGWEADFTNPRKHRRSLPPDSGVQWESGWHWSSTTSPSKLNGLVSPTGTNFDDYDFPAKPVAAVDAAARSNCASLNVPPRTLSSYASADSLLKRSLQSGSLRRPRRPESPSSYLTHARARSPLAGELDDTEYYGSESGFAVPSPPQYMPDTAYPSRVPAEISLRQASSGYPTQRVPMSMAMTTITSTVTAGDDAGPGRKGKGKGKARALETPPRPARKRSLTVQGALSPRPSTVDSLRDSPGTGTLHTPEGGGERSAKPGRLKLAKLSFAQVAAVSSGSSYLGSRNLAPPPLSATSTSSFESPQFARPEESD